MPEDELLTVADVADRLRLNQQTVRNWIDRGELSAVRLGSRRVRVLSSELDRFLAESAARQGPNETASRAEFEEALEAVQAAEADDDLAAALRQLAKAATRLARALPRR